MITAKQGQTWDMISFEAYGSEYYVWELMLANPELHGTVVFEGGERIVIQELEDEEDETWN